MKEYICATTKDLDSVFGIVQSSIKEIYPQYYPKEVVDFFSDLHSSENVLKDIEDGLVGILVVDGTYVGTTFLRNGKFSMTTHCGGLLLKEEYKSTISHNFI